MIMTTFSGHVLPGVSPGQMPQYWSRPVAYINELKEIELSPEYGEAIVGHVHKVAAKGNDFIEDVINISTWYEPPKGTIVDTWA